MAKAYWISCYRAISDPDALAAYAKLAALAVQAAGGRFVVRGVAARAFEAGLEQRTVVVEFAGLPQAIAAYESKAYKAALAALGSGAERDFRVVEGVD